MRCPVATCLLALLTLERTHLAAEPTPPAVLEGFTIEKAAQSPLIQRPIFAAFDEAGLLFVGESSGENLKRDDMLAKKPHWITRLEDTDGDGVFDTSVKFVEGITLPQGMLCYRGSVYAACPPSIWKFTDTDGDGKADTREEILTGFGFSGNACDTHGPFLSPTGRLYIAQGRHGHEFKDKDGKTYSKGKAARIYSCRLDGSDVRVHCGGGFDNPVEIDFTEEGEAIGTVNILYRDRGDCLMHWVEGGVYPREDQADCVAEFKWTGGLLGPVHNLGHVACSGLMRYRGVHFGDEFKNRWFVTEFNTHKIRYAELKRSGSTFTADVHEFLTSSSPDFHPTDMLEDADGSLLVVDTGAWFLNGCPTSKAAKPEELGGIWRVRKTGGTKLDDPRGKTLELARQKPEVWIKHLDDARPAVRQSAIELLVRDKSKAVTSSLTAHVHDTDASVASRIAAVQAIYRQTRSLPDVHWRSLRDKNTPAAVWMAMLYAAAASKTTLPTIGAGPDSLAENHPELMRAEIEAYAVTLLNARKMVLPKQPPTKRRFIDLLSLFSDGLSLDGIEYLTPFGVIVQESKDGVRLRNPDPVLEHCAVLALIRLAQTDYDPITHLDEMVKICLDVFDDEKPERLKRAQSNGLLSAADRAQLEHKERMSRNAIKSKLERVRLIALDQMDNSPLTREMVVPHLSTDDPALLAAVLEVISRRNGWGDETLALFKEWLNEGEASPERLVAIRSFLTAQARDAGVQRWIADELTEATVTGAERLALLDVLQQGLIETWPAVWTEPLRENLKSPHDDIRLKSLEVVMARDLGELVATVRDIGGSAARMTDLRGLAFAFVLAHQKDEVARELFIGARSGFTDDEWSPRVRAATAQGLARAPLNDEQLTSIAENLPKAGPLAAPLVLSAFARSQNEAVGLKLVDVLTRNADALNVAPDELASILRRYPASVQTAAAELLKKLGVDPEAQRLKLEELSPLLEGGDAKAGQTVFTSKKANCAACHQVGGQGGRIGPDLTKIAISRSPRDLLEALIYPSASFVNGYRPYIVLTESGKIHVGVISSETTDTITLKQQDLTEVRVPRQQIDEVKEGTVSIMPKGLDTQLTPEELRNLLAYLRARK